MIMLRADLDKLRLLSEQVQKREKYKLDKIRKQKAYLEMILYPVELVIKPVLDQLIEQVYAIIIIIFKKNVLIHFVIGWIRKSYLDTQ